MPSNNQDFAHLRTHFFMSYRTLMGSIDEMAVPLSILSLVLFRKIAASAGCGLESIQRETPQNRWLKRAPQEAQQKNAEKASGKEEESGWRKNEHLFNSKISMP